MMSEGQNKLLLLFHACVTLAKRMNDEMLQSQRLVRLHGSNQLKRIKEGADEAFAPARVAETALKMYALYFDTPLRYLY